METTELLKLVSDLGTDGVLLLILWQGLKRFDKLLDLVITLAARGNMTPNEVEEIRAQVFGKNGQRK